MRLFRCNWLVVSGAILFVDTLVIRQFYSSIATLILSFVGLYPRRVGQDTEKIGIVRRSDGHD